MSRKTIFLVDDDITNLTIGKNVLAKDYNVFTLNSGARLLKMLEKMIPDLILLDVDMPEMSGYDTIRLIKRKEEATDIPIIFLTAKNDFASELEGLSLGAIDYISKPFSPTLLLKRIEVHLLVESQKKELISYNENLQGMVNAKTETVVELQNAILKSMAEIVEYREDATGGHIERTQDYIRVMINAMTDNGLHKDIISSWDMDIVLQSVQLHDVGKISIKDNILLKPGKLTNDEYEIIKEHTTLGEKIIEEIEKNTTDQAFLRYAKVLAGTHHEKWDGSGYPLGLRGEAIPLLGRLMAIADVYDALVSEKTYKKALSHKETVDIILCESGKHFEPALVDLFHSVSDRFNDIFTLHNVKVGGSI